MRWSARSRRQCRVARVPTQSSAPWTACGSPDQIVEHDDPLAAFEELAYDMAADVTGAAVTENGGSLQAALLLGYTGQTAIIARTGKDERDAVIAHAARRIQQAEPFAELSPDLVIAAINGLGLACDGRVLARNSYENRVYRSGVESQDPASRSSTGPPWSRDPSSKSMSSPWASRRLMCRSSLPR